MSDTKDSGIDFVRREHRDAYLAIRAEALEEAANGPAMPLTLSQWQPIETAPKDGMVVDLWLPGLPHPAFPECKTDHPPGRETNCWWDDFTERWNGINGSDYLQIATHWMLPPEPPCR